MPVRIVRLCRHVILFVFLISVSSVFGCSAYQSTSSQSSHVVQSILVRNTQPPGPALLVTMPATNQLAFVDPATLTIRTILTVPGNPTFVAMHPKNAVAFLSVNNGSGIQLVDTAAQKLLTVISVPSGFFRFVLTPDGDRIYAVNYTGTISVISVVHKAVVQTITVGVETNGVAYSKKYHEIYVSTEDTNSISVFDADTYMPDKPIYGGRCLPDPCRPTDLATNSDGSYLLVADIHGVVLAMDARTGKILGRMTLSNSSNRHDVFLSMNPANGYIGVSDIGCCVQTVSEVPTTPPFTGPTVLSGANLRTEIVGVAFDASGHAWDAANAYAPRVGRVVSLPFHSGDKELVLGQAPGGIAYAP